MVERLDGLSLEEAMAELERAGYTAQMGAKADAQVACFACRAGSPAKEVSFDRIGRVEGASDPSSEAIVAGVTCPRCKAKGTLVLTYGPEAPAEDASVLAALEDRRVRPHVSP